MALTFLVSLSMLLFIGCGGTDQAVTGQDVSSGTAAVSDATTQFQRYEQSHFGFFRPGGSYPYVSELGVHWQRPHPGPFVWGAIEPVEGVYDWTLVDQYVRESQDYGILIDATIWPYADWDQQRCHQKLPGSPQRFMPTLGDYRGKPCDPEAYKQFVTALVERYNGDGRDDMPGLVYPIKYWEVINEPELNTGSPFFQGNPQSADYLEVLNATSQAIRGADPGAKVLNGGIAGLDGERKIFWQDVLGTGGGAGLIDVLTVHAVPAGEDLNLIPLDDLMNSLGLDRPVWVTEIMLAPRSRTAAVDAPSQDEFSSLLVREYVAAFGRGAQRLFYMGLDNATPSAVNSLLVNCSQVTGGELQEDHLELAGCQKQKPFDAFRTIVAKLDYFDSVQKLADGQYRFSINGRQVYVLWGNQPLPGEISGRVTLTDIFGARSEMDAAGVTLTNTPVYVEVN
ncbi:MAG: hypothetical protein ACYCXF_06670 [Thermoleophilia bacterium]